MAFEKGILQPKNPELNFPKKNIIEAIKYTLSSSQLESTVPFNFSVWNSYAQISIEIEFNSNQQIFKELQNIDFHFEKIYGSFDVSDTINSSHIVDHYLIWKVPRLNKELSSASITIDFEEEINENDILPIIINIHSTETAMELYVEKAFNEKGEEIEFGGEKLLESQGFFIS